jgi:hypothetical protein
MAKNNQSFFDTATTENSDDVIDDFQPEDLSIPLGDPEDEDEDEQEEEEEDRPAPKPKAKSASKKKADVEEQEEEEEEEEEEPEDDKEEEEEESDEDEISVYEATALSLIDDDVLIPVEGKNYKDSATGLAELVEDTVEAKLRARVPEEYQSILEAIEAGIPANEWAANQQQVAYVDADLEDEDTQKYLVTQSLKLQGFDADKIEKKINRYIKDGNLEEEAEEAQSVLIKDEQKRTKEYNDQLKVQVENKRKQDKEYVDSLKKEISETKEVAGFYLTKESQKELFDYLNKPVTPKGETQFMIDRNDKKKLIEIGFLAMKGINSDKLQKVAGSKAAKKLRDSLDSKSDSSSSSKGRIPKERVSQGRMQGKMLWDRDNYDPDDEG